MVTAGDQYLTVGKNTLSLDDQGFLVSADAWSDAVARAFAEDQGITLTQAHFEILRLLRTLYFDFDLAPANRALVKVVREKLGKEKGHSIYLMSLFGGSPAREAARLAGLPKPPHCL